MRPRQSHEDDHLLSHHHLYRSNTNMEFRDSFSRLKKKVKHRLTGSKPKPKKTGADVGEERVDLMGSRPGSESRVVVGGGHDQEGKEANLGESQVLSKIRLQQDEPGSVLACGSIGGQERREADADGGEAEQTHSHLHLVDVEGAERSGPAEGKDIDREKVGQFDPSSSTTSTPHHGKSDST